ncbi:hypothetical protein Mgra_00003266 [Meloidogyne graminicola]|uniref:Uncharacterized protein n=1 Tax=Meloidogyne graminicola TaxID=189291 RepID=A0A8S9ZVL5_9BILA|nr:hypothetical protein Mgra_00003266 [Meloidogyne graminicola]
MFCQLARQDQTNSLRKTRRLSSNSLEHVIHKT